MNTTGIDVLDTSIQRINRMLDDIMEAMNWHEKHRAYIALRSVLHILRDRMIPEEALHLGDQLSLIVKGIYFDSWKLTDKPLTIRRKEEFFSILSSHFRDYNVDVNPEKLFKEVIKVLYSYVDSGELNQVKNSLPKDFQEYFPNI